MTESLTPILGNSRFILALLPRYYLAFNSALDAKIEFMLTLGLECALQSLASFLLLLLLVDPDLVPIISLSISYFFTGAFVGALL